MQKFHRWLGENVKGVFLMTFLLLYAFFFFCNGSHVQDNIIIPFYFALVENKYV